MSNLGLNFNFQTLVKKLTFIVLTCELVYSFSSRTLKSKCSIVIFFNDQKLNFCAVLPCSGTCRYIGAMRQVELQHLTYDNLNTAILECNKTINFSIFTVCIFLFTDVVH